MSLFMIYLFVLNIASFADAYSSDEKQKNANVVIFVATLIVITIILMSKWIGLIK